MSKFRVIPSIDHLRQRRRIRELEVSYGLPVISAALRDAAADLRRQIAEGTVELDTSEEASDHLVERVATAVVGALAPSLQPVINATGVVIHTNLGRAPLGRPAIDAIARIAAGYSNLEFDLGRGKRGDRAAHAASLLQRLTGAEQAIVVNNNAAAVLLTLSALAAGREVIISRGELVEIGGGFRIPDVLNQSGARLREVGTTNRTRAEDYAAAIGDKTAAILRVHPSNFRVEGFAHRPSLAEVVRIGRRFDIPVIEDLGSGNVYPTGSHLPAGIDEPTVRESLVAGVTVCCISGDKLLGGPQAGIILGRAAAIGAIARHPLMRAVRADKLAYAALEATLLEHVCDRASDTVPVARMLTVSCQTLRGRATEIERRVAAVNGLRVTTHEGRSVIGGGTTPSVTLPTIVLDVEVHALAAAEAERRLRAGTPPVLGRVERDRLLLDLRTVAPEEDDTLTAALTALARGA